MVLHLQRFPVIGLNTAWNGLLLLFLLILAGAFLKVLLDFALDLGLLLQVVLDHKLVDVLQVLFGFDFTTYVLLHVDGMMLTFFDKVHPYFLPISKPIRRSNRHVRILS